MGPRGCRFSRSSSCRGKPTPSLLPRTRALPAPGHAGSRASCAVGPAFSSRFASACLTWSAAGRAECGEAAELRINFDRIVTELWVNTKGISAWGVTSCARTKLLLEDGRKHEVTTA